MNFPTPQNKRFQVILAASIIAFLSFQSNMLKADLILSFAEKDLTVKSNGQDQSFTVGINVSHDGIGDFSLSGFTLEVKNPGFGLIITEPASSPYDWDFGPSVSQKGNGDFEIGALDTQDFDFLDGGTTLLASVTFELDKSVISKTFDLDLTVTEAVRGGFNDVLSEVSATDGMFVVTSSAVPEPGSIVLCGILLLVTCVAIAVQRLRSPHMVQE